MADKQVSKKSTLLIAGACLAGVIGLAVLVLGPPLGLFLGGKQAADQKVVENFGPVASFSAPKAWDTAISEPTYWVWKPKQHNDVSLELKQKSVAHEGVESFKALLGTDARQLTDDDMKSFGGIVDDALTAKTTAEIKDIDGQHVLSTKQVSATNNRQQQSIYVMPAEPVDSVIELSYSAPQERFVQYLPDAQKSLDSLRLR